MRRNEKAITRKEDIIDLLKSATICRISLADHGTPYIVPVHYGYANGALYIHSATEGRKISIIKANHLVCFEIETDVEVLPSDSACGFSTAYRSVIGYGRASLVYDKEIKKKAMDIIMRQQTGSGGWEYEDSALDRFVIIRVEIESTSGKESLP